MGRLNYDQAPALGVPTAANGDVSNQAASTAFVQNLIPPGVVFPYAGPIPPTGWLLADGSAISRTVYARLFTAIGTTYGVGDGSTTFNLPDLRGEFLRGLDNGRGVDAGRALGSRQDGSVVGMGDPTLTATNVIGLYNTVDDDAGAFRARLNGEQPASGLSGVGVASGSAATSGAAYTAISMATRPRNVALNYIIKAQ